MQLPFISGLIFFYRSALKERQFYINLYDTAVEEFNAGQYQEAMNKFYALVGKRESLFNGITPRDYYQLCAQEIEKMTPVCPTCGQKIHLAENAYDE